MEIRSAKREDVPRLMPLVRAMLSYHSDPLDNFTEQAILRDGFGSEPEFWILVAEENDVLLGYALFHEAYETAFAARGFYLNDIFVSEAARSKGVGRALLRAVGKEAQQRHRSFVWWVAQNWNDSAIRFYERLGAKAAGVSAFALTTEQLDALTERHSSDSP